MARPSNESLLEERDALRLKVAELEAHIASLSAAPVTAAAPIESPKAPDYSKIPDNPDDPRPDFDPGLGWQTPAVQEWVQRQLQ